MNLDDFIITCFCWIDDQMAILTKQQRLRQRGPHPKLTDSEVLTMEVVGSYLGMSQDKALFTFFREHYAHFFPQMTRVHRSSFVFESIDTAQSSSLFEQLVTAQTITSVGILNTQSIGYDTVSPLFKICWTALVTSDIPASEAKEAFSLLEEHDLLQKAVLAGCDLAGILSSDFTAKTSLDFLFKDDGKAQLKRGQVKALLLQVRLNILNTQQVLLDKNQMQRDFAINGLSDFLKMPTATIVALFPFVTNHTDPGAYLKDLLTPDQVLKPAYT